MNIFCVGIGGIGLSGVAQILRSEGHEVSGSDSSPSKITAALKKGGMRVYGEHSSQHLPEDADLLIYSEAIPEENPERRKAQELGVKTINYAEALGMVTEGKKTIAVTGTHGKTTVTGMLTSILLEAHVDPSIVLGSTMMLLDGRNVRVGKGDYFLTEACEYRGNFLHLSPTIVLINTLEPDHLDYFKNEDNYYAAFQQLAEKIPAHGHLILFDNDASKLQLSRVKAQVKIVSDELWCQSPYRLKVPGVHNQHNACAAQATSEVIGIPPETIRKGLEQFSGTWRRFEWKGTVNGASVYDDYGHHPTEVRATIAGAREWFPKENLIVVFQPHQYSRTKHFFQEFSTAFLAADEVWITDIYQARDTEEDKKGLTAEILAKAIAEHQRSRYIPFEDIAREIPFRANQKTIFLIMGAGNIHQLFHHLAFDESSQKREDL